MPCLLRFVRVITEELICGCVGEREYECMFFVCVCVCVRVSAAVRTVPS